MSTERVAKNWQSVGLDNSSNEAILGTLNHYGVTMDESGYRALAQDKYPMAIALEWQSQWKGTGQFARFPFAAASELWRRFEAGRLLPTDYATVIGELCNATLRRLDGGPEAPVKAAFEKLDGFKAQVPTVDGGADEGFVQEVFAHFGEELIRAFDGLAERLAQKGLLDEARTFAQLEEFLIPERAGVSAAVVKAAAGERDEAVKDLVALTDDAKRTLTARVAAADALIHFEAYDHLLGGRLEKMLDESEKLDDHHLPLELASRLHHVLKASGAQQEALAAIEARAEKLQEAHLKAHPHHHH